MFGPFLDVQMSFRAAGARDCAPCQNVSKTWGCCICFNSVGRRGTFEEDLQRCIFCMAGAIQETFSSEMLGGQGADFLRGVAFWCIRSWGLQDDFAWQVQHFVWPGITFSWQAQYFRDMGWKNGKTHWHEAVSSAPNLHFWRKSRRFVSFFMLSTSKIEEVSQTFVFDVVKFKNWGNMAKLLRLWCSQNQKLRKSRRMASFSGLQIDR